MPTQAIKALKAQGRTSGTVELYLGVQGTCGNNGLSLRAKWAAVGWPVGACLAFLVAALQRPEELD